MPLVAASRLYPWQGNCGIVGGIPNTSTWTQTTSTGTFADVQNRVSTAAANTVINIPAGSYDWGSGGAVTQFLDFQGSANNILIRGAVDVNGAPTTLITFQRYIYIRGHYDSSGFTSNVLQLASSAVQGATSITVTGTINPAYWRSGQIYCLNQQTDTSFCQPTGEETGLLDIPGRALMQCVKITSIVGQTINFECPIAYPFSTAFSAQITSNGYDPSAGSAKAGIGFENLSITCPAGGTFADGNINVFDFETCDSCWVKNCSVIDQPGRIGIHTVSCYRCEFRHNYISNSHLFGAGQGYGIAIYYETHGCLIEDNILELLHVNLQCNYGSTGNVFAYNYERSGLPATQQVDTIDTHGCHTWWTLFEGNYGDDKILLDFIHGSGSNNTCLRNKINGWNPTNGYDQCAFESGPYNRHCNAVGNVLGTAGQHTFYMAVTPGSWDANVDKPIYSIGFNNPLGLFVPPSETVAVSDLFLALNYNTVNAGINAAETNAQPLPNSYYLASKPANFGILTWPPFDPAVTRPDLLGPATIPAGYRFINGKDPPASVTSISGTVRMTPKAAETPNPMLLHDSQVII
jgi:hypothetical protein